ncbi:BMP family ABC transporter substrate-binding protein OS=Streptomyces tendae OX=1932 GN=F3L20_04270 PE=3 SV=1 [Streptomyces tendae]
MRRISRLTSVAVGVASLALAATACGGTSGESGDDGGDDEGLAIAYDVGGKGDQSFNDAAYAGLQRPRRSSATRPPTSSPPTARRTPTRNSA